MDITYTIKLNRLYSIEAEFRLLGQMFIARYTFKANNIADIAEL